MSGAAEASSLLDDVDEVGDVRESVEGANNSSVIVVLSSHC
jgi:hypothetical protein